MPRARFRDLSNGLDIIQEFEQDDFRAHRVYILCGIQDPVKRTGGPGGVETIILPPVSSFPVSHPRH